MVIHNIAFIWNHGQSRMGTLPTARELETLIEERRQRVATLLQTTPLAALGTTDFWDAVILDMLEHYFSVGVSIPFDIADSEMVRRQAEHVIQNRFGTHPRDLLDNLDRDARAIVRYIEAAWDDALWAA